MKTMLDRLDLICRDTADATGGTTDTSTATDTTTTTATDTTDTSTSADTTQTDADAKGGDVKGAPEKYEAFTVPEGFALDAEFMDKDVLPMFKELGITQDGAQKLVSILAERELAGKTATEKAAVESFNATVEGWRAENAKNPAMVKDASDAMAVLATPELKAALEPLGLGDHPAVVGFFAKLKGMMNEDRFVRGAEAPQKKPFYHNSPGLK